MLIEQCNPSNFLFIIVRLRVVIFFLLLLFFFVFLSPFFVFRHVRVTFHFLLMARMLQASVPHALRMFSFYWACVFVLSLSFSEGIRIDGHLSHTSAWRVFFLFNRLLWVEWTLIDFFECSQILTILYFVLYVNWTVQSFEFSFYSRSPAFWHLFLASFLRLSLCSCHFSFFGDGDICYKASFQYAFHIFLIESVFFFFSFIFWKHWNERAFLVNKNMWTGI